jgi:hypothetical protein
MKEDKKKGMEISDKLLFWKYALPCAVPSKAADKEDADRMIAEVSKGKIPDEDPRSIFPIAPKLCEAAALKLGKQVIDAGVIRFYFLLRHNEVVDSSASQVKDYDPEDCKTYSGIVTKTGIMSKTGGVLAEVETNRGAREYRTDFCAGVKEGDRVTVHFDFIVEKLSDSQFKRLDAEVKLLGTEKSKSV